MCPSLIWWFCKLHNRLLHVRHVLLSEEFPATCPLSFELLMDFVSAHLSSHSHLDRLTCETLPTSPSHYSHSSSTHWTWSAATDKSDDTSSPECLSFPRLMSLYERWMMYVLYFLTSMSTVHVYMIRHCFLRYALHFIIQRSVFLETKYIMSETGWRKEHDIDCLNFQKFLYFWSDRLMYFNFERTAFLWSYRFVNLFSFFCIFYINFIVNCQSSCLDGHWSVVFFVSIFF